MARENGSFNQVTPPIDVFTDPVGRIFETPEGRLAAKQFAAVTIIGFHLAHGATEKDTRLIAKGIMRQTNPKLTKTSFLVARSLVDSNPST